MNIQDIDKTPPAPDLCGRGVRGWHMPADSAQPAYDLLELEPYQHFGGDCSRDQVWEILAGEGFLSIEGRMHRLAVIPNDAIPINAGERTLLLARTTVRFAIRVSIHAPEYDQPRQSLLTSG